MIQVGLQRGGHRFQSVILQAIHDLGQDAYRIKYPLQALPAQHRGMEQILQTLPENQQATGQVAAIHSRYVAWK